MIVLNTLPPLVGPPCPSRLLPRFSAQKEHELLSFQSIPLFINSINLKRDGVRICFTERCGTMPVLRFVGFLVVWFVAFLLLRLVSVLVVLFVSAL